MTHKIINTETYLLIVDESEIKEGDWFLNNYSSSYYIDKKASESSQRFALNSNNVFINPKKIIAHLPLSNSPILEGVDLLPPISNHLIFNNSPKYIIINETTTNSQGLTQWVGEYIYD